MAKLIHCSNCKQFFEPDPRKKGKSDRGYWDSDLKLCPICENPTQVVKK